ncbi:SdpI family protein [Flavobacterium sp. D11R37]|uniref:SdpI family protein n=1 Tax=Flavobacterium coralii TaxID=2838017 RepID=UPI001CA6CE4A|nr:SdpI family protein [Flavobacterium coralii]MBY8963335.1 SdpI family protein [Flavobacterium coralii]
MEQTLENFISNTAFLVGVILLASALLMILFSPRGINYLYGYRTSRSMKSQQAWDFAQRCSSVKMLWVSMVLLITGIINVLFIENQEFIVISGVALLILGAVYIFYATEKALKTKFPD